MFGWEQAIAIGSRAPFVTEGEEDAMALFQVLRDGYEKAAPVVSITRGTGFAVTQLVHRLKARLCLSGTSTENHLG